ncbi:conserved hypothetical protein [Ramlibacter tataouinensis TTB310]|uniref:Glucose/Sorbosone dehydrogenase domain-containing protein n=1 Tax=Ramlibacter tataouinensis (strain ATCC BAA-407 / DSM 14655 / LMG 21543 / TTB310) TaxID=365046 RepID=F5Y4A2_RAMTT|nr:conserved hypothetical protein [Ramlibacter tataouinensis TTB310]
MTTRATGLSSPWGMAFLLDGRLLVTERTGGLKLLSGEGSVLGNVGLALPNLVVEGQGGLMDVALDPAFASNGRVYLSFSERDPGNPALNGTAVARGELSADARTLSNVTVIYRQQPKVASTAHFGSRLVFDREGRLWVTLGDRRTNEQRGFAQDLTRGNGKVVRITTDGAPAPGNPTWPAGALAETWSYGLRNPQGAAVHPATGDLWTSDHGPQGGDEINRTVAGANFGWPLASHGQEYGTTTPVGPQTLAGTVGPAWVWNTRDGQPWTGGAMSSPAPAGISFYTGTAVPQWNGNLFVTSLAGRALWRLTLDGNTVTGQERLLASRNQRLRDVEQGPDGALYLLTDDGQLLRYGP